MRLVFVLSDLAPRPWRRSVEAGYEVRHYKEAGASVGWSVGPRDERGVFFSEVRVVARHNLDTGELLGLAIDAPASTPSTPGLSHDASEAVLVMVGGWPAALGLDPDAAGWRIPLADGAVRPSGAFAEPLPRDQWERL